jgi:hypothetical protein
MGEAEEEDSGSDGKLGLEGGFDVEGDICDFIELNNL